MRFPVKKTFAAILGLSILAGTASAADAVLFEIREFKIDATQDIGAVQDVLRGYVGSQKNFRDVMGAIDALKAHYAQAGADVAISLPPEQDITDGVIRLRVTSAEDRKRLREVHDRGHIREAFPSLKEGQMVNLVEMRMSTALFNENPYRATFIEYATSNEGTDVALGIEQKRKPVVFIAALDNSGVRSTGRERLTLSVQKMDLPGDALAGATFVVSPQKPDSVNVFMVRYKTPLYSQYASIEVYAARSSSDAGVVGDFFSVSGKGYIYGGKYVRYLPSESEGVTQQVSVGLEQRDYINSVTIPGSPLSLVPDYTIQPLTVGYGLRNNAGWGVSSSLTHGMYGGDLGVIRAGAASGYNILKANGDYAFAVTDGVSLEVSGSAQYTGDLLVSSEQFGVGGTASVRGLNERELSGDNGVRVSAELRKMVAKSVVASVFADSARAWRNSPLPGEMASSGAAGIGVGLRYFWKDSITATAELAHVLRGDGETKRGASRVLATLTYSF